MAFRDCRRLRANWCDLSHRGSIACFAANSFLATPETVTSDARRAVLERYRRQHRGEGTLDGTMRQGDRERPASAGCLFLNKIAENKEEQPCQVKEDHFKRE